MPKPSFFEQFGLFVFSEFLDSRFSVDLCRRIEAAPVEKGVVIGPEGEQAVNLDSRKVDCCLLSQEIRVPVEQRLQELKPALEAHFDLPLPSYEPPQYLVYKAGDFFKPHLDVGGYGTKSFITTRRVSVVIFLNRQSQDPEENTYGEGQLTFYGLLDGPQWERCAFPLDAEPGLLVAFPSDKWHEVRPISHGRRFTVVTWFHGHPGSDPVIDAGSGTRVSAGV